MIDQWRKCRTALRRWILQDAEVGDHLLEVPVEAWQYLERPAKTHSRRLLVLLAVGIFTLGLLTAEMFVAKPCEATARVTPGEVAKPIPTVNDRDFPHLVPTPAPTPKPTPKPTPAPVKPFLGWPLCVPGRITQYYRAGHYAIDLAAPCGTRVLASLTATVVWAGPKSNGGGLVVDLSTGSPPTEGYPGRTGWFVSYNHLSSWSVKVGQKVTRGQTLGHVGATGWASGCHLHFMVAHLGYWQNPLPLL